VFLFSPIPVPFQQSSNDDGWDPVRALLVLIPPPFEPSRSNSREIWDGKADKSYYPPPFSLFLKQNLTSCPIAKCEGQQLKSPNVVVVVV
jgi:hypothetical protein